MNESKEPEGLPDNGTAIDFHSAEFNRTDDLTDCAGNSRIFQSLAGVVTADMRHQMERRRPSNAAAGCASPAKDRGRAREAEAEEPPRDQTPLTVVSQGRTLIVGADDGRAAACAEALGEQGLDCTLLITKDKSAAPPLLRFAPFERVEAGSVSISGAFGGYFATVAENGERRPFGKGPGDGVSFFDLVLDLQVTPSYAGAALPMGYYAPQEDAASLAEAMAELPRMKGRFQRPQFTTFLKSRCLHGRSRSRDCRRCLDVCPFGAVQSAGGAVAIDHYRCQGCGGCALVCPTDAIHAIHPSREEVLARLQGTLEDFADRAAAPTVVISEMENGGGYSLPESDGEDRGPRIDFAVGEIAHVGLEMLLAALAYGAGSVVIACGAQNPPAIREAVEREVRMGRAVMEELGMPKERIGFVVLPAESGPVENGKGAAAGPGRQPLPPPLPAATFSWARERRSLVRLAARHLSDQSGLHKTALLLPADSPFGAVAADQAACTLCMACAVACPSGALFARGDVPRLEFIETKCHQCGLCREACPEGALTLSPRILCGNDEGESPVTLNEAEPFRCIVCGVPFASQAMIDRIQGKLSGHWMYAADRQLRRLKMCRTCRTQDALGSQEMNSWNQI